MTTVLLAVAALCAAGLGMIALWRRPVLTVNLYLASLILTPYWLGVNVSFFFISVQVVMAMVSIAVLAGTPAPPVRVKFPDFAIALVFVLMVVGYLFFRTPSSAVYIFLSQWLPAYIVGRMAVSRCGLSFFRNFAVLMAIPAIFGVVEFATGFNPWTKFVVVHNSLFSTWATEQSRGGFVRAEASFGHSIAFGCCLAIAAVFALASNLSKRNRLTLLALLLVSSVFTLSRTGMVCAVLGVLILVLMDQDSDLRAIRKPLLWSLAGGGVLVGLYMVYVLTAAGPGAANSAFYRLWILDLLPSLRPVGLASSAVQLSNGSTVFGGYHSIDSAVLYFALQNGWVPAALLISLVLAAIVLLFRRGVTPALVAIVAQIPAYVSVALITQYAMVLFLVGGVAVATVPAKKHRRPGPDNGFTWGPPVIGVRNSVRRPSRAMVGSAFDDHREGDESGDSDSVPVGTRAARAADFATVETSNSDSSNAPVRGIQ